MVTVHGTSNASADPGNETLQKTYTLSIFTVSDKYIGKIKEKEKVDQGQSDEQSKHNTA